MRLYSNSTQNFDHKKGMAMLYPLKLIPAFKDYLWGGTRLKTDFDKHTPLEKVAESWELSCHKDGAGVIANGSLKGTTLIDYIARSGKKVLGTHCEAFEEFPILIKLIDAYDNLSVQVHPDNDYALRVEGEYGKTEMWVIVDALPDAALLYGFKEEISRAEFRERIENNTLLEVVNRVPVKKGDVFFIEAGTLHAIGKGILIAEIQQNSNTTYRVYDYGRVGADGKPRQLHIDKAVEVTTLAPPARAVGAVGKPKKLPGGTSTLLASCDYFTVYAETVSTTMEKLAGADSFHSLLLLEGEAELGWQSDLSDTPLTLTVKKGDSIFIPAGMGAYTITGKADYLFTTI